MKTSLFLLSLISSELIYVDIVQVPPWPKAIAWYNKGGRVEPSEKYHVIEDGIGGYSIEVKQVEAVDEGEWKCVATSEENMKQFTSCYVAMSSTYCNSKELVVTMKSVIVVSTCAFCSR